MKNRSAVKTMIVPVCIIGVKNIKAIETISVIVDFKKKLLINCCVAQGITKLRNPFACKNHKFGASCQRSWKILHYKICKFGSKYNRDQKTPILIHYVMHIFIG